ncbi:DPP IV N-terminal domain-containing protein [Algoriphagus halophytocola]|uniref:DPP IV N-terminal domain-containing protein n=1 Tax=Algoriphagus halophytocola TaxID=2991499 RepID=A0ABY6MDP5_9BACT|nr:MULTISPECIES: DPP IV N-terminal domain-containing protein [unclassified Algoriphagus]UZD21014.1 DPP IV N-terminal domain-containing protein [Algoriphagus sp. TR-M5]WBL42180.1 DPP IV N-terminal domain-containing protein [Algoriphagus sp. TR-M9]
MHFPRHFLSLVILFSLVATSVIAQQKDLLTLERIYASNEFRQERLQPIQWIENGDAYVTVENGNELARWDSKSLEKSIFVPGSALQSNGKPLQLESFSLSEDGSKVLIFTNSSRVWRSNTKGDYYVYDLESGALKQLGQDFEPSSLMFAKFSADNSKVAYVQKFNLYLEDFETGQVTQLTSDGTDKIINGTFDWAYEEEFGKRDGFAWSPDAKFISFWQIDASKIGTFYMINNTDSVYSRPIPLQYPKVGEEPAGAKIGLVDIASQKTKWIPIPGGEKENYLPGMQWINDDLLLIQQMNRKQNQLTIWTYKPSHEELKKIYVESEKTWVDLAYPDLSRYGWSDNSLPLVDEGKAFLRMTETDGWRHIYKVDLASGNKTLLTPGEYDVASFGGLSDKEVFFIASPKNATQRYLYAIDLAGKGKLRRVTPEAFEGVNTYDIAPNGQFAVHNHQSTSEPLTTRLISLPKHEVLKTLVENQAYKAKLASLKTPEIKFTTVTTSEGVTLDARIIYPVDFDETKKYPVLFHVYGEPWSTVATDTQVGLYNIMLVQKGYFIIDMDNRGTPTLKGSDWRKSIYRKIGVINAQDQGLAAKELLKLPYLDESRVAVWGWSGGGSMTLNLMFKFPEIYQTGMSVAAVSNQLIYDNIYQERYMGLPQENMEDFVNGSPITYAKNLEGNLLIVHGTGDDNVHYQGAEMLMNELIKHNKQFQMMPYPNRSHGIYEGAGTSLHLYTLLTNYLMEHTPVN